MYDTDGDFGQVRLVDGLFPPEMEEAAPGFTNAGWHSCNSQYRICRPDGAAVYLLLATVGGEGRLILDGRTYRLTPGTLAVVPPRRPNLYETPEGGLWEFYWIHPAGGAAVRLLDYARTLPPEGTPPVLKVDVRPYAEGIERLLGLHGDSRGTRASAAAQTAALLCRLLEDMAGEGKREEAVSEKVIRYMESRCGQPLPLRELAAQAYLSPSQLIRRFRRETGFTPHDYLNRLRIAKAGRLLRYTDKTVSEVAREVGFRQPSRFIELYRELNGVTPGRERG